MSKGIYNTDKGEQINNWIWKGDGEVLSLVAAVVSNRL